MAHLSVVGNTPTISLLEPNILIATLFKIFCHLLIFCQTSLYILQIFGIIIRYLLYIIWGSAPNTNLETFPLNYCLEYFFFRIVFLLFYIRVNLCQCFPTNIFADHHSNLLYFNFWDKKIFLAGPVGDSNPAWSCTYGLLSMRGSQNLLHNLFYLDKRWKSDLKEKHF